MRSFSPTLVLNWVYPNPNKFKNQDVDSGYLREGPSSSISPCYFYDFIPKRKNITDNGNTNRFLTNHFQFLLRMANSGNESFAPLSIRQIRNTERIDYNL